ncbi:hypothetical protein SBC2_09840 [Caballeronia sp. SBC2]|nr:hypothetical protein SBC2_09840 [Caballeronia sp. SBC2]
MPTFAVFADHVPTAFLSSIGLLSCGPGRTVYGQAVVEATTNSGFIRLSATDEGVVPLVDWLNNHRHHDSRNELRAAAHILYSLRTGLEGAWDYLPERPYQIGPTSLFALIAGFIDLFLSASQFKSEGDVGTLDRWNQAFQEMSSEVFALYYAHPGARPKVDTVVRAFHRALTSTA